MARNIKTAKDVRDLTECNTFEGSVKVFGDEDLAFKPENSINAWEIQEIQNKGYNLEFVTDKWLVFYPE